MLNLMLKTNTRKITYCALFAALTAILSQIVIPIGPVPVNLATFAVFCAGAMLGSKWGAFSMFIWAALGLCGVPVFHLFQSGIGTLAGPTGGYIIGYIPAAYVSGLGFRRGAPRFAWFFMFLAACIYFILGTLWFMFSTNTRLFEALTLCVFPFIPGDLLKIIAAVFVTKHHKKPPAVRPGPP